jgi:hypothetical protein
MLSEWFVTKTGVLPWNLEVRCKGHAPIDQAGKESTEPSSRVELNSFFRYRPSLIIGFRNRA